MELILRSVMFYILLLIVMRLMGKRQLSELQPFELVVTIMLAELAVIPIEDTDVSISEGIIPIITIMLLQFLFSYVTRKNIKLRSIICGIPVILIENGKIIQKSLRKQMISINDLMEQLRIKGSANPQDVEFAILETNGDLSVFPYSHAMPPTSLMMDIKADKQSVPITIIIEGYVLKDNLEKSGYNINWLNDKLGILSVSDVYFAYFNTKGEFVAVKRDVK